MDLIVGDMHVQPNNLEESKKLLDFIRTTFIERNCDKLIFLGDLTHTHAVLRQEVAYLLVDFFRSFLNEVVNGDKKRIIVLVGNHDGISPIITSKNALELILSEFATVVSNEPVIDSDKNYVYMPFMYDNSKFVESANEAFLTFNDRSVVPVLFCHQTFDGASYENGHPCPGGVNSEEIPFEQIVSGHIHLRQVINEKVVYVGTPRPISASECNAYKYIHTINRQDDNYLVFRDFTTKDIIKSYIIREIIEGSESSDQNEDTLSHLAHSCDYSKDDVRVRIIGTETFYEEQAKICKAINKNIKVIPVIKKDLTKKVNLEATNDSVETALEKYIKNIADLDDQMREEVWRTVVQMSN